MFKLIICPNQLFFKCFTSQKLFWVSSMKMSFLTILLTYLMIDKVRP